MNVLIWGTGENAKKYLDRGELKPEEIVGFIESRPAVSEFPNKSGRKYKVFKPDDIKWFIYDFILVCVWKEEAVDEIFDICMRLEILDDRIVFMRNVRGISLQGDRPVYYNKYQDDVRIKEVFPVFWKELMQKTDTALKVVTARTIEDMLGNSLLQTTDFHDYTVDYFRYRTFEFVAQEIKERGVAGDVAEVGVAWGTFSRLINAVFSDRSLYMFDTFDSFDRKEFDSDSAAATDSEDFFNDYKNISVEDVIKSMPYKDKCMIRQGLFPDTAAGLEDLTFAFVSIDVDLEKSIYNSLVYFYPRLNPGGVLFVHDYRCQNLEGVKRAVSRYEEECGAFCKVPIADRSGTLIIMK